MTDKREFKVVDEQEIFEEANFYQCVDCDYASAIEPDLQEHNNEAHAPHERKAPEPNGQTTSTNNKDGKYKCQQFNYEAKRKSTLEYHMKLNHTNPAKDIVGSVDPITSFKCNTCEYITKKASHLREHIKAVHDKIKDFKCLLCPYASSYKSQLKNHKKKHHQENGQTIYENLELPQGSGREETPSGRRHGHAAKRLLDKPSYSKSSIKITQVSSLREETIKFEPHWKDLFANDELQNIKNESNKKTIQNCLKSTQKNHDRTKKYKCHVCTYRAKQKVHLKEHIKTVHDKIRDFKCHLCTYETTRKSNLERHIISHHKNTMHPGFSTKMHSKHSKVAESIYSFEKEIGIKSENDDNHIEGEGQIEIDKKVNIKKVLAINFTKRNGKFRCNPCGKFFTRLHSVNDHINSHHAGTHHMPMLPCFSGL